MRDRPLTRCRVRIISELRFGASGFVTENFGGRFALGSAGRYGRTNSMPASTYDVFKITDELTSQETALGVEAMPPVWGNKIPVDQYFQIMLERTSAGDELLSPPEVGCTLAHLNIYREIVKRRKAAIIVEQDMTVCQSDLEAIDAMLAQDPVDFLHLAEYEGWPFVGKEVRLGIYEITSLSDFWGTAAYYLSPACAESLLEFHSVYLHKADDWRHFFDSSDIAPYHAPIFYHAGDISTIDEMREKSRPIAAKRLFRRRAREHLIRLKILILHAWRARQQIKPNHRRGV